MIELMNEQADRDKSGNFFVCNLVDVFFVDGII